MSVAVIGSGGQLGRQVAGTIRLGHGDLDLASLQTIAPALDRLRPEGVILTAAYTNVDGCETNLDYAMAVNGAAPGEVAAWCQSSGAWILYISTDYVFDGEKRTPYLEGDRPNPMSAYGRSKLAGEQAVQAACERHFIVRTSWVFGPGGVNFVTKILDAARSRPEMGGVEDEVSSPTYAPDLAAALPAIVAAGRYGTFHLSNAGACSRLEYIRAILDLAGWEKAVRPMKLADFPRPARPPRYSALANVRAAQLGIALRPWQEALADYLSTAVEVAERRGLEAR